MTPGRGTAGPGPVQAPPGAPRRIALPRGRALLVGTGAIGVAGLPQWALSMRTWYGWSIRACLTHAARNLVSEAALAAATGAPVAGPRWHTDQGVTPHLELAGWADLIIVAPATTNFVGKCALGLPDSLALATVLSAEVPVVLAPSIPEGAYRRPSVQRNLKQLDEEGYYVVPPQAGLSVHSGELGPGAMADLVTVLRFVDSLGW